MRNMRLSLVIPALLTRTAGASSLSSDSIAVTTDSGLLTSIISPRPLPLSDVLIFSAPDAVVAVPITKRPCSAKACAIAAPIPLEAPVTSATSLTSRHRRLNPIGRSEALCGRPFGNTAYEPGKNIARAYFNKPVNASIKHRSNAS